MIHETSLSIQDRRTGPVYLRFGTGKPPLSLGKDTLVIIGQNLEGDSPLTTIRTNLIMTAAEAIRLSDELRRLASLITK